MSSISKNQIIAKELEVSEVFVRQVGSGIRGKRGSAIQDKIQLCSAKADEILLEAKIEIVKYCNQVKFNGFVKL